LKWLYQDGFRDGGANAQPGIANLANEIGLSRQEFNALLFAQTHFAQPLRDIR
jgi:hypothetical protein